MNTIGKLIVEKVVDWMLEDNNVRDLIAKLLQKIPGASSIAEISSALEELKNKPNEENLDYLAETLEQHGQLEADQFAALIVNEANVKV